MSAPARVQLAAGVLALLREHRGLFAVVVAASLLASIAEGLGVGLVIPLLESPEAPGSLFSRLPFLEGLAGVVAEMSVAQRLRFVALALIALALARGGFVYVGRILSFLLQIRVDQGLRRAVFRQLLEVEIGYIHKQELGNLFTVLNNYTANAGVLVRTVGLAMVNVLTVLTYTVLMFLVSWQLTALAVALLFGIVFVIKKRFTARLQRAGEAVNAATARLNAQGLENLGALQLSHISARAARVLETYGRALAAYRDKLFAQSKLVSLMEPLFSTLNAVILGLLLIASSFLLPAAAASTGVVLLFVIILYRLMAPVSGLNSARAQVVTLYPGLQAAQAFLRRDDKPYLQDGHRPFETLHQGLRLEGVSFAYAPQERPVLRDVTLEVPKGKTTAVVGPSGAGKTTLIHLIARLYDPQRGRVQVDGVDLREHRIESWRSRIAVVSQSTFIFNDTVVANFKFAKGDATLEEIQRAAALANADAFIRALPQGYDTVLGDRGVRLSGGQQQRVAIARALLLDPELLILDEATSNLDSETERKIQEAVERVSRGRTVLAVAHRLSTVRHADHIVVLDGGRVAEQGDHASLMAGQGLYRKLVEAQSLEHEAASPRGERS